MNKTLRKPLAASLALAALLAPAGVNATVVQLVRTGFESVPLAIDDLTDDRVIVPFGMPVPRPVFSSIGSRLDGYEASASIGVFGNLGVSARHGVGGKMLTDVIIGSSEFVNTFGTPIRATANFIIDGGFLNLVAGSFGGVGAPATLNFQLKLTSRATGASRREWQSNINMSSTDFINVDIELLGEDIGASRHPTISTAVEIPISFNTFDLGIIPPGGMIGLEYFLHIRSNAPVAEVVEWGFSDPLSVDGTGEGPTVTFSVVDPRGVAEPATLALLAVALLPLARRRVRD